MISSAVQQLDRAAEVLEARRRCDWIIIDLSRLTKIDSHELQGCVHRIAIGDAVFALRIGHRDRQWILETYWETTATGSKSRLDAVTTYA